MIVDVVATVFSDTWVSTRSDVTATAFFRLDDREGITMLTSGMAGMIKSPATSGKEFSKKTMLRSIFEVQSAVYYLGCQFAATQPDIRQVDSEWFQFAVPE